MSELSDKGKKLPSEILEAISADQFAQEMDDVLLDIADLDPEVCAPDRRILKGDREAWIYEHGNISELVFVRVG